VPFSYEDHFALLLFVDSDFEQYAEQLELTRPVPYDELLIYRSLLLCKQKMLKALKGNTDTPEY
jgi:hypothetical protein